MTNRIILSGILWGTALVAAAQVSYLDRVAVETKAVRKVDDKVTVDLLWQFNGLKVNTQNQAEFIPVLVASSRFCRRARAQMGKRTPRTV